MDIKAKYSRMIKSAFPEYGQSINRKIYRNLIWFELFIFLVMFSGVLIFSQGFLLSRRALENNNQCSLIKQGNLWNQQFNLNETINPEMADATVEESCWYPTHFKKAVVLIIDALRYDFLHWEDDINKINPYFSNKLTIIHKLLTEQPNNAFEFQFKSDPPTTTMQRLKGLTTGTLPTFIDAGKNFAASAITEDNIIQKIISNGKKIKFMGDDTWMSLFGEYLDETSIPCDSLNVWDLYSVDNKIKEHLFPSLKQKEKDWDVLFAHFLGVDHCGHRYEPNNEHMELKLREMNGVIEDVIKEIDDDTLLVIMGDHGMSEEGDHGGETENELNAGLFFYSKKGFNVNGSNKEYFQKFIKDLKPIEIESEHEIYRTIPQIDFAPTFALLLGLPIPFENIGTIIPELFWYPSPYGKNNNIEANILQNVMEALRINTYQLQNFIETYYANSKSTKKEAKEKYQIIEKRLENFIEKHKDGIFDDDTEELKNIIYDYISYNRQALYGFRQVWAKFNVPLFTFGICILLLGIASQVVYLLSNHNIVEFNSTHHYLFPFGIGSVTAILMYYGVSDILVKHLFGVTLKLEPYQAFLGGFSFGACIGYLLSYLLVPNGRKSIIDNIKPLILQQHLDAFAISIVVIHGFLINSDSYIIYEDSIVQYILQLIGLYFLWKAFKQQIGQIRNKMITFTIIYMIIIRITSYYDLCRDERKGTCETTVKTSLPNYYISICSLVFFPFFLKKIINENYYGTAKPITRYLIPSGLASSGIYWGIDTLEALNMIPSHLKYLTEFKYYLARYGFIIIPVLSLAIWVMFPVTLDAKVEPSKINKDINILNFYGSKNHLGSSYLIFLSIIIMSIILVSKPISTLVVILCFCAFICLLEICSLEKESNQILVNAEIFWNKKPLDEKRILLKEMEEENYENSNQENNSENKNKSKNKNNSKINTITYDLKTKDGNYMRLSHEELIEIACNVTSSFDIPFIYAVVTYLLTLHIFFRTGHQSTLQSIDWSLAFIGQKELNFIKGGFTMVLNTLSGEIISCLFIPLFVFWKQETTNDYEKPMVKSICKSFIKYSVAYGFPQVMSVISAGSHKRHLMLWRVFAPRYMIGGISLCFVQVFSIISIIAIIIMIKGITKHLQNIKEINNKEKSH